MGDSYDADRAGTYISPRALAIGFALYCIGFLLLLFGANWVSETYEARAPLDATPSVPASVGSAKSAAPPLTHGAPRVHAGLAAGQCAPAPPCNVNPARKGTQPAAGIPRVAKPALKLAPSGSPAFLRRSGADVARNAPAAAPARANAARPAHAAVTHVPAAAVAPVVIRRPRPATPIARAATPAARAATPAARAATPAGVLVPFASASGLTSGGGLDPRAGSHALLVVGPTSGFNPRRR
jgi:hypothetical protein